MPEYKNIADGYFGGALELGAALYPLEGIQLAAAALLDEGFFYLYGDGGAKVSTVSVAMRPREGGALDGEGLEAAFIGELNRQCLKIHMTKMNRKVRVQVVGRALASSLPVEEEEVK